jgi:hypothetical protein
MGRSFVVAAIATIAWAAVPSAPIAVGVGALAAVTVLAGSEASAGTAIQPGWRHSCGRNPRCFDRAEARRRAKLNAGYVRQQ